MQGLPGNQVVAVASRDAKRASEFAASLGITRHYASYESLAADPMLDVVYIATPNTLHHAHAMLCLNHGRAVLIEKPVAINAGEADAIFATAREKDLFCMEAMWARFAPPFQALREQLAENRIGRIQSFEASLGFAHPFDPADRLFDKQLGGGVTLDLVTYPVSLLIALFGSPARIDASAQFGNSGVDETVRIQMRFAPQISGTIECSFREQLANRLVIRGERGTLSVAPLYMPQTLEHQPRLTGLLGRLAQRLQRVRRFTPEHTSLQGYQFEAHATAECLRSAVPESPAMTHADSILVMQTLDNIRRQIGLAYPHEPRPREGSGQ